MRIAHIIMAHKNPGQLARFIERLQHPNFDFYIHLDSKVPIDNFKHLENDINIFFIKKRTDCNWGGNSLLMGIVNALNEVVHLEKEYGYINMLSAQDYPLMPAKDIYNFFVERPGKSFISFDESRESLWWKEAAARYERYHLTDLNLKWKYFFERILNSVAPIRKFPNAMELYGSSKSTWWTINGNCAKYVANQILNNKKLSKFLKYTWGTDEFVVSTVIMNSQFKDHVINNNLRYIDWSEGKAHPKLLGIEDLEKLKDSKMMFARKFDVDFDGEVLNKIDEICLHYTT